FFMVRVAGLRHAVADGDAAPDLSGLTPAQQLAAVAERAHSMVDALYRLTEQEIMPALAAAGVRIVAWKDLHAGRRGAPADPFPSATLPGLTPLAIDAARPFPLLSSLSLNLALRLDGGDSDADCRFAIVQVPAGLTRLVPLGEPGSFLLLEDLVA